MDLRVWAIWTIRAVEKISSILLMYVSYFSRYQLWHSLSLQISLICPKGVLVHQNLLQMALEKQHFEPVEIDLEDQDEESKAVEQN